MSILVMLFGFLFVIFTIVSIVSYSEIKIHIKKIIELEKSKIFLKDLHIREEINKIDSNIFPLQGLVVCGCCFLIFLGLYIDNHINIHDQPSYKSVTYKFKNNTITKITQKCYRVKWDADTCEILDTQSITVNEIFGDNNDSNSSDK